MNYFMVPSKEFFLWIARAQALRARTITYISHKLLLFPGFISSHFKDAHYPLPNLILTIFY